MTKSIESIAMSNILKSAVFDRVGVPKLTHFLDLGAMRHRLIAGNLANTMTPGYKSKDIDFSSEAQAFDAHRPRLTPVTTHPGHISLGQDAHGPAQVVEDSSSPSNGINNVSVDREMAQVSVNQINYTIGAQLMQRKFASLRKAITGRS